jgi:ATP-dependent DNA ligase
LSSTEQNTPPVAQTRVPGAHWVRPTSVAQVAFSEWTRDGKLRHPRYLGLRTDKSPDEVVRETR